MNAVRKRETGCRYIDLVPTVSAAALDAHHAERARTLQAQRYQTGPRHGQELAAKRKRAQG